MTDISKFFTALSERAYKENDLSDVTYAMCKANLAFRQIFLDFFFKDLNLNAKDVAVAREKSYSNTSSRPDFVFQFGNNVYFVEVKIWDGSHHFAGYKETLLKDEKVPEEKFAEHFGYITNYTIVEEQLSAEDQGVYKTMKSRVKTWREFAEELKKYQMLNSPLVEAYFDYLVRVCPYDDFTVTGEYQLSVESFAMVATVYKLICDIVQKLEGVVPYNRSPRQFQSMRRMGRYFEYAKFKETEGANESSVWGWLGVVYEKIGNAWNARICVEFENTPGWGEKVCNKYKDMVKNGVLRFYYEGKLDEEGLKNFVNGVLKGGVHATKTNCGNSFNELLVMKTLPFVIENYFYGKLNDEWMIERGCDSDEENPTSHCGRYFKLRRINETGDMSSSRDDIPQGWVGVMFDERAHFGRVFDDVPVFVVQLPKCEGVFELNSDWLQDQCSKYWWSKKLNSMPVEGLANAFKDCLKSVLKEEVQDDRTSV